jgi:hypothetical protein
MTLLPMPIRYLIFPPTPGHPGPKSQLEGLLKLVGLVGTQWFRELQAARVGQTAQS